jgi:uncharacterized protein
MHNSKQTIDEFIALKSYAVVGVSRNKDKFGNAIYRELKAKGRRVSAVNPQLDMVEGDRCYAGLGALPEKPDAVVMVIPPQKTLPVIDEMARLGIKYLWLQQGAESREAEKKAEELGIKLVSGECLLMFLQPVGSIHGFHRTLKRIFGGLPK